MRDLCFSDADTANEQQSLNAIESTIEIGKKFLESLHDTNNLKPKVWAQQREKTRFFGVSLGVRSFVRPLYLYIKLRELRNSKDKYNTVKLQVVVAYIHEQKIDHTN